MNWMEGTLEANSFTENILIKYLDSTLELIGERLNGTGTPYWFISFFSIAPVCDLFEDEDEDFLIYCHFFLSFFTEMIGTLGLERSLVDLSELVSQLSQTEAGSKPLPKDILTPFGYLDLLIDTFIYDMARSNHDILISYFGKRLVDIIAVIIDSSVNQELSGTFGESLGKFMNSEFINFLPYIFTQVDSFSKIFEEISSLYDGLIRLRIKKKIVTELSVIGIKRVDNMNDELSEEQKKRVIKELRSKKVINPTDDQFNSARSSFIIENINLSIEDIHELVVSGVDDEQIDEEIDDIVENMCNELTKYEYPIYVDYLSNEVTDDKIG